MILPSFVTCSTIFRPHTTVLYHPLFKEHLIAQRNLKSNQEGESRSKKKTNQTRTQNVNPASRVVEVRLAVNTPSRVVEVQPAVNASSRVVEVQPPVNALNVSFCSWE